MKIIWLILSVLLIVGSLAGSATFGYEIGTFDYYDRPPVSGTLTADGVQYSTVVTTATADTVKTLFSRTVQPTEKGTLLWPEFYFEPEFAASSSVTADITWTVYAKDLDATNWVTLATTTLTNPGTSWTASVKQGRITTSDDLDTVPFQWKIEFSCNEANEGKGRLKSTTYVRAVFRGYKK